MGWVFSESSVWLRMKVSILVKPVVGDVLLLELIEYPQVEAPAIPCCCIPLQAQNWKQPSDTSETEHPRHTVTAGLKVTD